MPDGSTLPPPLPPLRQWFRIGEVSRLVGVADHVLRFWGESFKLRTERSKAGQRVYTRKTVELLVRIKHLLYVEGYTIDGARRRLKTAETCPHCGKELGDGERSND